MEKTIKRQLVIEHLNLASSDDVPVSRLIRWLDAVKDLVTTPKDVEQEKYQRKVTCLYEDIVGKPIQDATDKEIQELIVLSPTQLAPLEDTYVLMDKVKNRIRRRIDEEDTPVDILIQDMRMFLDMDDEVRNG